MRARNRAERRRPLDSGVHSRVHTGRMSSCCSGAGGGNPNGARLCPVSGTKGAPVELQTVKALLTENALRRVTDVTHRFCSDPACAIVYFANDGQTYGTADIRVPVWQKEPAGARVVCYCFGENEADIRAEIERHGRSDAVERVRRQIQAGRCACEVRNPRGVCCLGDLTAAVKRLTPADEGETERGMEWASTRRIRSASLRPEAG